MLEVDSYDMDRAEFLVSIISLEIDLYIKKDKSNLVNDCLNLLLYVREVKWDPKIIAIVRECEAKVEMSKKNWQVAFEELKRSYNDLISIADNRAEKILIYILLTEFLGKLDSNVLDQEEYSGYVENKHVKTMLTLIQQVKNQSGSSQITSTIKELDDHFITIFEKDILDYTSNKQRRPSRPSQVAKRPMDL